MGLREINVDTYFDVMTPEVKRQKKTIREHNFAKPMYISSKNVNYMFGEIEFKHLRKHKMLLHLK